MLITNGGAHHADLPPGRLCRACIAAPLCCRSFSCSCLPSLLVWLAHCKATPLPFHGACKLLVQVFTILRTVWQELLQHLGGQSSLHYRPAVSSIGAHTCWGHADLAQMLMFGSNGYTGLLPAAVSALSLTSDLPEVTSTARSGLQRSGPACNQSPFDTILEDPGQQRSSAHHEAVCSPFRIRSSSVFVREMTKWMRKSSMSTQTRTGTARQIHVLPGRVRRLLRSQKSCLNRHQTAQSAQPGSILC